MVETEPGAVGQRAEDPGEDRKLMAAACGWSVVLESGGPGQQAVPWGEGGLRPWGHCHLLVLPLAGGSQRNQARAGVAQGEGPSSRASNVAGCPPAWRPTGWGRAWLSFSRGPFF